MEVFRQKATCNSLSPCVRICIMSISVMAKPKRERRWNVWPTYDPTRHATIFGRVTSYDPICLLVGQSVSWLVGRSAVVIISKKGLFFSKLPVPSPRAHLLFFVQQSSPPGNNRNVGSQFLDVDLMRSFESFLDKNSSGACRWVVFGSATLSTPLPSVLGQFMYLRNYSQGRNIVIWRHLYC